MDFEKAIENSIKTGNVKIGSEETLKAIEEEKADLVILAKNCPWEINDEISKNAKESEIKVIETDYFNDELGTICGRPHSVASLAIVDPGNSDILGFGIGVEDE